MNHTIALSVVLMLEARWLQTERMIPGRDRTASRLAQTPGPMCTGAETPVHSSAKFRNAWRYTLPSQYFFMAQLLMRPIDILTLVL
jgi:hypothetical protein